jgi:hypothetical protein
VPEAATREREEERGRGCDPPIREREGGDWAWLAGWPYCAEMAYAARVSFFSFFPFLFYLKI